MHLPRKRTRQAAPFAAAVAVVTVLFGLSAPASAASTGPAKRKPAAVVNVCGTPKKGEVTCFALRRADVNGGKGIRPAAATPSGYGPGDLRAAYQLPAGGGAGQTVAIVDAYDDPNAEADLAVYRQQFGLPPCAAADGCFTKVDQRGGTTYPPSNTSWSEEISLDLDMVSAVAPAAHILLVEADSAVFSDMAAAVDRAVALGAKFVSNSYGTSYSTVPGSGEDPSETTDLDPHYNRPGVAMVASSGDDGYGVSYPAASTYVTAVGGTSLVPDSSARGFTESVWNNSYGGPGSGCSLYESKPAFQQDTGCDKRAEVDVSAVADPATGVAVYDSFGASGWGEFGGTSASSPIIAGVYALAGAPTAGSYPNAYPYAHPEALNDVTTGNNGSCTPDYLCTAGAGYDGPTGLGTPKGVAAFAAGPHGDISGTVTDAGTGAPVAGASVTAGDAGSTVTDAQGHYDLTIPPGTYTVTASAYGYASASASGVVLTDGGHVTQNLALTALPRSTISGTVRDGSGHGWPLYAKLTVSGMPGGPVFTDPITGRYSFQVPQGSSYGIQVSANYPGYQATRVVVPVGTTDVAQDFALPVDSQACDAPGYKLNFTGSTQTFDGTTAPAGWTVSNANANGGWVFQDLKPRGNLTGGSGGFAIIDSDYIGQGLTEDTTLTSPVVDLSTVASPDLSFDTDYHAYPNSTADVDVSVDGGTVWTNVWHHDSDDVRGPAHVDIPLPMAGQQAKVVARFHYVGTWAWWWELDNVFFGNKSCDPVPGGLVAGLVTDANTKAGLTGAQVSSVDKPAESAVTSATPDDPNLGDGFYWMFSSVTGSHAFTASQDRYTPLTKTKNVVANTTTKLNFALAAGRISVSPTSISKTLAWGGTATAKLTVKNTGTAPATVDIGESPGGFQLLAKLAGAPKHLVPGKYSSGRLAGGKAARAATAAPRDATPAEAPWTAIADYPTPIQDNLAATYNGTVYSAFGYDGGADVASLYAYDADTGSWTKLASAADTREKPAGGFIGGKLYVTGGWGASGDPDPKLEIYDPATGTWGTGADNPKPHAGAGSAILSGKLYAVGGCDTNTCGSTDVMVYDPATNAWSQAAAYPEPTSWESCGGIGTRLYCAGGTAGDSTSNHAYAYNPSANAWYPVAPLPIDLWASGYVVAGGKLLVSGGVTGNSTAVTNQGFAYDRGSDTWTALPNANNTLYRGGAACGFYRVGGNPGGSTAPPVPRAEVLPGLVDCSAVPDVSWLSTSATHLTLAAGASTTVTVTLDASVPDVTQPGTYAASLIVDTDTPYRVSQVGVTMSVKPPKTWGKITGTVTSAATGAPIPGATIQIDTWANSYTLRTDKNGQYALWLDVRNNPLQVIAAKDGYQPQVKSVKITKAGTTTLDFSLKKAP